MAGVSTVALRLLSFETLLLAKMLMFYGRNYPLDVHAGPTAVWRCPRPRLQLPEEPTLATDDFCREYAVVLLISQKAICNVGPELF